MRNIFKVAGTSSTSFALMSSVFAQTAPEQKGVATANNPRAPAASKADAKGKYFYDHTQQTVFGDQKNLTYYARFFGGSDIFKFNMKDYDWNAKERKQWAIPKTSSYKTVSN